VHAALREQEDSRVGLQGGLVHCLAQRADPMMKKTPVRDSGPAADDYWPRGASTLSPRSSPSIRKPTLCPGWIRIRSSFANTAWRSVGSLVTSHLCLVNLESDLTDREFQALLKSFDALERLRNRNASEAQDSDEREVGSLTAQLHRARAEAAGRAVTTDEAAATLESLESEGLKLIIRSGETP
jgi:hypothetical protein